MKGVNNQASFSLDESIADHIRCLRSRTREAVIQYCNRNENRDELARICFRNSNHLVFPKCDSDLYCTSYNVGSSGNLMKFVY